MVKHRSGTRWPNDREAGWRRVWSAPCTSRWGVRVSWFDLKTKVVEFSGLGLKIGSSSLVIWALKSPRRFLGLGLKTKHATVCQLPHKTGRRRLAQDTRRVLVACFTWKQVELGFPSLPQNWRRNDGGWCTWHHRGDRVELKLKMDGSMRWAASDSSYDIPPLSKDGQS
jgi:hypothetical protein